MSATLTANAWLVVGVPLVLSLVVVAAGRRLAGVAPWIAVLGPILTVACGATWLLASIGQGEAEAAGHSAAVASGSIPWFAVGERTLSIGWSVDALTAIMLLVVGVVAACVVVFSTGYMRGDSGWVRYYALLSLFTGAMNLLVIASTLTTLFIGWELVGACSYLLIGFWYRKPSAAAAAIKAFLTTRVGDVGLLLGIAVLWTATGTDDYAALFANVSMIPAAALTAATICLAIGAMGKSAQFPLHAWLPDAMEGPTPVSALIHAATMVAAGVFLVARLWPLFEPTTAARTLLLAAGVISALGAALAAVAQRDIKKVLAYSTISQLGLMFAALGAGAWVAAFFHLVTHAAFKALLFLGSGSVIHGTETQDLHEMGGLRRSMPITFVTWTIGALALAGIPPLAGFFSKDALIEAVWLEGPAIAVTLLAASTITAFYMARTTRLAFFGAPAPGLHAHEGPASMTLPLVVLAALAASLGLASGFVFTALGHEPEPLALGMSAVASSLAVAGGIAGWVLCAGPAGDERLASTLGGVWRLLAAGFRWDALVDTVVVRPVRQACVALWAVGDRLVADGAVEATPRLARRIGNRLSSLHTGDAQSYAGAIVVAFILMLVAAVWLGR